VIVAFVLLRDLAVLGVGIARGVVVGSGSDSVDGSVPVFCCLVVRVINVPYPSSGRRSVCLNPLALAGPRHDWCRDWVCARSFRFPRSRRDRRRSRGGHMSRPTPKMAGSVE
jgi:hypothetical protein